MKIEINPPDCAGFSRPFAVVTLDGHKSYFVVTAKEVVSFGNDRPSTSDMASVAGRLSDEHPTLAAVLRRGRYRVMRHGSGPGPETDARSRELIIAQSDTGWSYRIRGTQVFQFGYKTEAEARSWGEERLEILVSMDGMGRRGRIAYSRRKMGLAV